MTAFDTLPADALHILQHSLGIDQYGQGEHYRNHFCTGEGSTDHPTCMALVEAGLMMRRPAVAMFGGDDLFHVTEAGKSFVAEHSPEPPKLTRSQRRWRRYLDSETSLSFADWLRTPYADLRNAA